MKFSLNSYRALLFISFVLLLFSCKKEEIKATNVTEIKTPLKDSITKNKGEISSLLCEEAIVIGQVVVDQEVVNTEIQVQYSGGNGYDYSSQEIASTTISGLKLHLPSGYFSIQRSGILKFKVIGKATSVGIATFPVVIGGQVGVLKINVSDGLTPTSGYGPNFKDVEGTVYKSVYIGNQLWQAEN